MKFKTLYKQASTGKIQQWTISVKGNVITTEYGINGGKLQTTQDVVREGKNIGRSNATTPETQAAAEALSSWEGKLKEGYVEDKTLAVSTRNTLEAVEPMLAHPIEAKEKYVTFPALGQPKLDGLRAIVILKNGVAKLYSRTQKEFTTVPHILREVEQCFKGRDAILDGEMYNHRFKKDFNAIVSLIKRDELHPKHALVQFHIYDVVAPGNYFERTAGLREAIRDTKYLIAHETKLISSREELEEYQLDCVERGYEGAMYRNPSYPYEHKRSAGLLKVKSFQDEEFKIVGAVEGRGKLMGKIGKFVCELPDGRTFGAKPMGSMEQLEEYWNDRNKLVGKMLTVKFQNWTPEKVPRFPVAKAIRDYE